MDSGGLILLFVKRRERPDERQTADRHDGDDRAEGHPRDDGEKHADTESGSEVSIATEPEPPGGIADIHDPRRGKRCVGLMAMARPTSTPAVPQLPENERREEDGNCQGHDDESHEDWRILQGSIVGRVVVVEDELPRISESKYASNADGDGDREPCEP